MSQNLWWVFLCAHLWIYYSKINFEVLYFSQISIFFEKNVVIGCMLSITTLQPLKLTFFNCRTKILTIQYFESFSISFYLLFFSICCTILIVLKFFKNVVNLPWKMNLKKHHHFGHFFIQMWACEVWLLGFLQGQNKDLCEFKSSCLAIQAMGISEIFSTCSQISILHDPSITCVQKYFFSKIWNL